MFEELDQEFEIFDDKNEKSEKIHTHIKKWRVAIYETRESYPINRSYSFLCMIPSVKEDNGAATFRNLTRQLSKIEKVEGIANLKTLYKKDVKHFANLTHLTLVYEGTLNGEGSAAGAFNSVQHDGNEIEENKE